MTDGIVWVVDSVDRCRLEECRKQLRDILSQEKLAGASLLIFANKQRRWIEFPVMIHVNFPHGV